ncbi:MAG: lysophospholipid acyltransferase family protein [Polyangia bacterium]|jgi:1-acyl-sn-glycerol-3-phosphate acyltransferase|nr:lysophospholipid acyltransferase family protein [Polyangia bacterium]
MELLKDQEVLERVERLELGFNSYGIDQFGVSKEHLVHFFSMLKWFYRHYFRVTVQGMGEVPSSGRAMLVGNHSGGLPVDGGMLLTALLLDHEPPLLAHGMVEKFANRWPFLSTWFSRVGQFTGLPEHATALLRADRVLMVFPEGARGTGKLYDQRYELVDFGTGFMRMALQTQTPIIPLAFVGGEEAIPVKLHLDGLARLVGAPYIPVTSYGLPIPLPVACSITFGAPMRFEGDGQEADAVIEEYVQAVKDEIVRLIDLGRKARRRRLGRLAPLGAMSEDDVPGEGAAP